MPDHSSHCKLIQRFECAPKLACAAICAKQKKLLITGDTTHRVSVWLLSKKEPITTLSGLTGAVTCVTSHPREDYIAGGDENGTIKLWDLQQGGKAVRTFGFAENAGCVGLEFHPMVDVMAAMSSENVIHLWDFPQRRIIKEIQCSQTTKSPVQRVAPPCVRFSPDGKWLCYTPLLRRTGDSNATVEVNDESTLRIWDLSGAKELFSVVHPLEEGPIVDLAFHPHHMVMVTITYAMTIRVWDITSFRLLSHVPRDQENRVLSTVQFTGDGSSLLLLYGDAVEKFSLDTETFQLTPMGSAPLPTQRAPSDLTLSGTSLINLHCDSSTSFSIWLLDTNFQPNEPPATVPEEAMPTPELDLDIPTPHVPSSQPQSPVKPIASKPIQPIDSRIAADRKNSEYRLDLEAFYHSLLSPSQAGNVTEATLLAELSSEKHKSFCSTMSKRLQLLKPLRAQTDKSNVSGVLGLFTAKDIDLAILATAMESILDQLENHKLTIDEVVTFNRLITLLLNSKVTLYMEIGLTCLVQLITHFANLIKSTRPSKLRESLQIAQKLSADSSVALSCRSAARSACKLFSEKSK